MATNTVPAFSASALAASTADAYAFQYFGAKQWAACSLVLASRGFNEPQAIAILYSKIMRIAADHRSGRRAMSSDLNRLLDSPDTQEHLAENLDDYVLNILGEDLVADEPIRRDSRTVLRLAWSRPV